MRTSAPRITSDMGNIRVRLDGQQLDAMIELARTNERSLAAEVRVAVKRYLEEVGPSEQARRR